jgi:hypothetical protein
MSRVQNSGFRKYLEIELHKYISTKYTAVNEIAMYNHTTNISLAVIQHIYR